MQRFAKLLLYWMATVILTLFVLLLGAWSAGCGGTVIQREKLVVKDSIITVVPPVVIDSNLIPHTITDSMIAALRLRGRDTVMSIQYYPQEKRFYVHVQPDTVRIIYRDTTHIVQLIPPAERPSFMQRVENNVVRIVTTSLVAVVIALAIAYLYPRLKTKIRSYYNDS
ncbi:MAG: hypothetical protein JNL32_00155 [Candidatus Kapabacteria bacterium]|nr:hypothetical protein [Candidatus Kapabacteria bacterium]